MVVHRILNMTRSAQLGDVGHNVGLITLSRYDNRLT